MVVFLVKRVVSPGAHRTSGFHCIPDMSALLLWDSCWDLSLLCKQRLSFPEHRLASGLHLRPVLLTPIVSSHSRDVAHWPTFSVVSMALTGPLVLLSGRTEVASLSLLLCGKATFCHGRWEEMKPRACIPSGN